MTTFSLQGTVGLCIIKQKNFLIVSVSFQHSCFLLSPGEIVKFPELEMQLEPGYPWCFSSASSLNPVSPECVAYVIWRRVDWVLDGYM